MLSVFAVKSSQTFTIYNQGDQKFQIDLEDVVQAQLNADKILEMKVNGYSFFNVKPYDDFVEVDLSAEGSGENVFAFNKQELLHIKTALAKDNAATLIREEEEEKVKKNRKKRNRKKKNKNRSTELSLNTVEMDNMRNTEEMSDLVENGNVIDDLEDDSGNASVVTSLDDSVEVHTNKESSVQSISADEVSEGYTLVGPKGENFTMQKFYYMLMEMKQDLSVVKRDIAFLKTEINFLKTEINFLKSEASYLRAERKQAQERPKN